MVHEFDIHTAMRLDGKSALILGGAGHVGATAAAVFAQLGAHVIVADIDKPRAESTAQAITNTYGNPCIALHVDLESEKSVRDLFTLVHQEHYGLDIVVHSAALVGTSPLEGWAVDFEMQSASTWRRAIEINLTSAFIVGQLSAPILGRSNGSLIFVSSIYGLLGPDFSLYEGTELGAPAAYFAGKAGLAHLARYLAVALAPAVRVNSISPGGIERNQPSKFRERYARKTPLGRLATESDLAGAFAFLGSSLSSYVTGHDLVVDGGLSCA